MSSLAVWVSALLDYHHARDVVRPSQEELATAEGILTKVWGTHPHLHTGAMCLVALQAELTLVAKQRIMVETKVEFKKAQKERSSICKQKKDAETKIAVSFPPYCYSHHDNLYLL